MNFIIVIQRLPPFYVLHLCFAILDTENERNMLMKDVYPKLKNYCQKLGYEFQIVDMRWGVRNETSIDHTTSELCMKEIK